MREDAQMTNNHPLIQVKNLDLYFGAFHALKNVSVDFHAGELVGLVGDNGAGKTKFYPNLNLSAAAGTESLLGDAMFGSASRFFNIMPLPALQSVTIPRQPPTIRPAPTSLP